MLVVIFFKNISNGPDIQATILHQFGIDYKKMIYKHQGRRFRLTDVRGEVVKQLLV